MIDAGSSVLVKRYSKGRIYSLACPGGDDAQACNVVVAADRSAESRGGAATVSSETDQMVWQANNGHDGMSDGAHAMGIVRLLDGGSTFGTGPGAGESLGDPTSTAIAGATGPGNANIQSTRDESQPNVTVLPTVAWSSGGPRLDLTLGVGAITPNLQTQNLSPDDHDLVRIDSKAPELGARWRGATLRRRYDSQGILGGRTTIANIYTDMADATGSLPEATVATGVNLHNAPDLGEITPTVTNVALQFGLDGSIGSNINVRVDAREWATIVAKDDEVDVTVSYVSGGSTVTREGKMTCRSDAGCRAQGGFLQGSWDFVVEAVDATRPSGWSDSYLYLGSWLSLPDRPDGDYVLGVFADGGSIAANSYTTTFNGIVGQATFKGMATGLYAKGTYSGRGSSRTLTAGEVGSFTANATLQANFGDATDGWGVAGANSGTSEFTGVSGTISNFREGDQFSQVGDHQPGKSLGNWAVSLRQTSPTVNAASNFLAVGKASADLDGRAARGEWGAQFYYDADIVTGGDLDAVAGTFSVSTDTGASAVITDSVNIVGAFGARVDRRQTTIDASITGLGSTQRQRN